MNQKNAVIGKKFKEVFGSKHPTPGKYRAILKGYEDAIKRLALDSYKVPRLRTHDQLLVLRRIEKMEEIRYFAQMKINPGGTIVQSLGMPPKTTSTK